MINDPRYEAARLRAAMSKVHTPARTGVAFSPLQQFPQPDGGAKAGSKEDYVARMKAASVQAGRADGNQGGWKGTLGAVLGNTAVSTALKPLTWLNVPGRTLKSTINELVDGVNGGDMSFDDWQAQMRDETFGFGDMIGDATDNKWVNRALGFVGDVALDPITYLTLGTGKAAGLAGRVAASAQLASKGASDDVVRKTARLGVTTLDDVTRESLNIGKAGVRFGPRKSDLVIPGTEKLASGVGQGLAEVRARIGDTALGGFGRKLRTPEDIAPYLDILTGRQPGNVRAAAATILGNDVTRATRGLVQNRFLKNTKAWDKLDGVRAVQATHLAEQGLDPVWSKYGDDLFGALGDNGASGVARRQNWVPHIATKEAREAATKDAEFNRLLPKDTGESVGLAFERKIEPNTDYTTNGIPWNSGDATIQTLNETLTPIMGFKPFKDDIREIARDALSMTAEDAARAKALNEITDLFPDLAKRVGFDEVTGMPLSGGVGAVGDIVDKAATSAVAKAQAKNWAKKLKKTDGKINDLRDRIRSDSKSAKRAAREDLKDIVDELSTVENAARNDIVNALKVQSDAPGIMRSLDDALRKVMKSTTKKLDAARSELAMAQANASAKGAKAGAVRGDFAEGVRVAGVERRVARRRTIAQLEKGVADLEGDMEVISRLTRMGADTGEVGAVEGAARISQQGVDDLTAQLQGLSGPVPLPNRGPLTYAEGVAQRAGVRAATKQANFSVRATEQQQAVTVLLADMGAARRTAADAAASQADSQRTLDEATQMIAASRKDLADVKRLDVKKNIGEMEAILRQYDPSDPFTANVLDQLVSIQKRLSDSDTLKFTRSNERAWMAAAKAGKVQPVMKSVLADGWTRMGDELLSGADGVAMKQDLAVMFKRVVDGTQDPAWAKFLDRYTQFFKAYATLSPGFHFRNGMSASFMNFTEGVSATSQIKALGMFKQLRDNPKTFMSNASSEVQDAVKAMYGSGAGGQFSRAELGDLDLLGKLTDNFLTRTSRQLGEWVEGPARLALALDTTAKGGSMSDALARVTRIHFDYSQLSKFDRTMKRFIPFWTFMSRNLPLQMQQMWAKPRAYAYYDSFKNNFDADQDNPDEQTVPLQWLEQGAFNTGLTSFGGNDLYAAPDLPHTRLLTELQKISNPKRFLADANPLMRVPIEVFFDQKMYSGNPFFPDESKALYAATSIIPIVSQLDRLSGGGITGAFGGETKYRQEKQGQSIAGYFGVPVRELTPSALEAELRRLARSGGG